jgi:hypothetical protein
MRVAARDAKGMHGASEAYLQEAQQSRAAALSNLILEQHEESSMDR